MCENICNIINNSAADCPILLKFRTVLGQVTLDIPRSRLQHDITYQHHKTL